MAADNGGHINFVGQEKHVGHDIDSVYDEEEVIEDQGERLQAQAGMRVW
jgi:hypothetical protein